MAFGKLYGWLNDLQVDALLRDAVSHGLTDLLRQQAHCDWHCALMTALGRSLPLWQLCMSVLFGL